MKTLFLPLLILALGLTAFGQTGGKTAGNPPLEAQQKMTWEPFMPMDNQLFPSFIIAVAQIQNEEDNEGFPIVSQKQAISSGRIGVVIKNLPPKSKIKYSIKIDGIADLQSFEKVSGNDGVYSVDKKENIDVVAPALAWNFEKLGHIDQPITANATFSLSINDQPAQTKTIVVRIRSVNDAVYAYSYKDADGQLKWVDSGWIFAAYVNEDHPWIDQILKEALDTGIVRQFDGYQSRDKKQVLMQIFAIWNVLQKRGFKYSSITDTSLGSNKVYSQYVRLFDDSIKTSQANCVDGSVLFASILKKIGINIKLVLIPGHCFLIFDNGEGMMGLETTMMGMVSLKDVANDSELKKTLGEGAADQVSLKTFLAAVDSGNKTYNQNYDNLIKDNDPRFQLIDVQKLRKVHQNQITR